MSIRLALATVAALAAPVTAGPNETFWDLLCCGQFTAAESWSNGAPDPTSTAIFDVEDEILVFFEFGDGVSNRVVVRDGGITLFLVESFVDPVPRMLDALSPTFIAPSISIGDDPLGAPALTVQAGLLHARYLVIGEAEGATGTLDVATHMGLAPAIISDTHVHVGLAGYGALTMAVPSTVQAADVIIGTVATGGGEVVLAHAAAQLDCAYGLTVGRGGQGVLDVGAGADVTCAQAIVGQQAYSTGTVLVHGAGTIWSIGQSLDVGLAGTGSVVISGGGTVLLGGFTSIGTLGPYFPAGTPGAVGAVTVTGPASSWISQGDIHVGFQSDGTLAVLDGAAVISVNGFVGADPEVAEPLGGATIQGPNSVWALAQTLTVHSTLTVGDGALVSAAAVQVGGTGVVTGDGTLVAEVTNGGTIAPGATIGAMTVDGAYLQGGGGVLEIELSDTGGDRLDVTGDAMLQGTLDVTLAGGYQPARGDAFTVLSAASIIGGFLQVSLPPPGPGLTWQLTAGFDEVRLQVVGEADLDGNGSVGTSDFLQLLGSWGPCPPGDCPADLDGSGDVGTADMLLLFGQWG